MGFTVDIPTSLNLPNTVVKRDSSSEFAATTVVGNLEGNATTSDDGLTSVQGNNGLILTLENKTLTATLDSSVIDGQLSVQENNVLVGQQGVINFISGSGIDLTVIEDEPGNRVNVTIDSTNASLGAQNVGGSNGSVDVYKQTSNGFLQFRKLNSASSKVSVALDAVNDELDVDIVPANINHDQLSNTGSITHSQIDLIIPELTSSKIDRVIGGVEHNIAVLNLTGNLADGGLSISQVSDKKYVHDQMVSASVWTVIHNLGKFPSVSVIDSAGTVVIGEITYTNANQLVVSFAAQFSGAAHCN